MNKAIGLSFFISLFSFSPMQAQGLTDLSNSQEAKMKNTPLGAVRWTGGFWGDVFDTMHSTTIWDMWNTWNTPWETLDEKGAHGSNGFRNFESQIRDDDPSRTETLKSAAAGFFRNNRFFTRIHTCNRARTGYIIDLIFY